MSPYEILLTDGAKLSRKKNNYNNNNNIVLKTYYFKTCIDIRYILYILNTMIATLMSNCIMSQYWMCVWRMVVIWRHNCLLFTLGYWKNLVIVYLIQFTVISQNHVYLPLSIDKSSQYTFNYIQHPGVTGLRWALQQHIYNIAIVQVQCFIA